MASISRQDALASRLEAKAGRLAQAQAQSRRRTQSNTTTHWRQADLLWPLFELES